MLCNSLPSLPLPYFLPFHPSDPLHSGSWLRHFPLSSAAFPMRWRKTHFCLFLPFLFSVLPFSASQSFPCCSLRGKTAPGPSLLTRREFPKLSRPRSLANTKFILLGHSSFPYYATTFIFCLISFVLRVMVVLVRGGDGVWVMVWSVGV